MKSGCKYADRALNRREPTIPRMTQKMNPPMPITKRLRPRRQHIVRYRAVNPMLTGPEREEEIITKSLNGALKIDAAATICL